jgi:hypothetical protein
MVTQLKLNPEFPTSTNTLENKTTAQGYMWMRLHISRKFIVKFNKIINSFNEIYNYFYKI